MAGLPWIKVWTVVPNHPKVQRLETALGVEDALGMVLRLWCWTAAYAPSGEVATADVGAMTRETVGPCVTRNASITDALVTAGFLDPIPTGFRVHDWHEMQTVHVEAEEKRKAQARERQARFRERHNASVTRDVTRDASSDVTVTLLSPSPSPSPSPSSDRSPSKDEERQGYSPPTPLNGKDSLDSEALSLLKLLPAKAIDVALALGLPRTAVDAALEDFQRRGLVRVVERGLTAQRELVQ